MRKDKPCQGAQQAAGQGTSPITTVRAAKPELRNPADSQNQAKCTGDAIQPPHPRTGKPNAEPMHGKYQPQDARQRTKTKGGRPQQEGKHVKRQEPAAHSQPAQSERQPAHPDNSQNEETATTNQKVSQYRVRLGERAQV